MATVSSLCFRTTGSANGNLTHRLGAGAVRFPFKGYGGRMISVNSLRDLHTALSKLVDESTNNTSNVNQL